MPVKERRGRSNGGFWIRAKESLSQQMACLNIVAEFSQWFCAAFLESKDKFSDEFRAYQLYPCSVKLLIVGGLWETFSWPLQAPSGLTNKCQVIKPGISLTIIFQNCLVKTRPSHLLGWHKAACITNMESTRFKMPPLAAQILTLQELNLSATSNRKDFWRSLHHQLLIWCLGQVSQKAEV